MSVPLTVNGVTFQYPQQFDRNWGPTLTGWSTAVTNALAPLSGGFLTLPFPTSGIVFRNSTNTGNLPLTVNGSNQLTFNGSPIGATTSLTDGHIFVGNISNQPSDVVMSGDITISDTGITTLGALKVNNSNIATLAGIAFTKLASTTPYFWYVANSAGVLYPIGVTASRAVITDANGLPSTSSVTPTELSYLSGVTSSIQTQLGTYLPLSGGTMSGNISMASNKITSLSFGSVSSDAAAFGQITATNLLGTNTNNNAVAGYIGEYARAYASNVANGTINVWSNIVSLALTAGDWDVSGNAYWTANGEGLTNADQQAIGLSLFSGNTTTDHVLGDNVSILSAPNSTGQGGFLGGCVPVWRVSTASSTTVYLKGLINNSSGTLGVWAGRVSARRAR